MWSRVEDAHRGRASQGDRDLEYDEDVDTQGDIEGANVQSLEQGIVAC